jgi:hypothetical protein
MKRPCKRTVSGSNPLTGSMSRGSRNTALPAETRRFIVLTVMAVRNLSSHLVTAAVRSLLHVGCTTARPRRTGSGRTFTLHAGGSGSALIPEPHRCHVLTSPNRGPGLLPLGGAPSPWCSPTLAGARPRGHVHPGLGCVRGMGALRGRGGGNHLRTGTGHDHRAAGRCVRSRPDGGKRRAHAAPGDGQSPGWH